MKKILLFLAIALFLTAGIVTATKMQSASNDATTVLVASVDDNSAVNPFADNDEKSKSKEAKAAKCDKENCNKENCKESCDKGEKKCDDKSKKCCSKDKGKK